MTKFARGYMKIASYHNEMMYETKVKRGSIPCLRTELNLPLTLHGGQSFRYNSLIMHKFIYTVCLTKKMLVSTI